MKGDYNCRVSTYSGYGRLTGITSGWVGHVRAQEDHGLSKHCRPASTRPGGHATETTMLNGGDWTNLVTGVRCRDKN